jgi:FOG: WD40-like repeat
MFHYDPAHTGTTNSSAPISTPKIVWQTMRLGSVSFSPAIVNGIVYACSSDLNAFNASTGEQLWTVEGGGDSSPVVQDGVVYTSGHGIAFNASTGAPMWNTSTLQFLGGGRNIIAVAYGYVYEGYSFYAGGSFYGAMTAVNATTGAVVWNVTSSPLSSPAVAEGYIYFGTMQGVLALNAYNGTRLWEYPTGDFVYSSPAVVDGRVFLSTASGDLLCLDALTGKNIWGDGTGQNVAYAYGPSSSPAIANGCVYVGSENGYVYAFNASNGAKLWTYLTYNGDKGYGVESSPVIANGVVYIGSDDGNLYALNASVGNKLWNYTIQTGTNRYLQNSVAIVNGRIYVSSLDHLVTVLVESKTAKELFSASFLFLIIVLSVILIISFIFIGRNRHKYSKSKAAHSVKQLSVS